MTTRHTILNIRFTAGTNDGYCDCGGCGWWGDIRAWESHKADSASTVEVEVCRRGHEGPWFVDAAGLRRCRECTRMHKRTYNARQRERLRQRKEGGARTDERYMVDL